MDSDDIAPVDRINGPMMQRLYSRATVESDLAHGAYRAIVSEGLALPTQRALAEQSRMSTSAVSRHCGADLARALAASTAWARARVHPRIGSGEGLAQWLPRTDDEVHDARVWLAWLELARGHDDVSPAICEVRGWDRDALGHELRAEGLADDAVVLTAVEALVAGLTQLMCEREKPVRYDEAAAALARVVDALRGAAG